VGSNQIVTWTPDLAIGVEVIDEQHREVFAHVARFLSTVESGRIEELLELLHFLGTYVEAHFRTEEDLMRESEYPDLGAHAKEHERFRAMFRAIVSQFARYGDDPRVGEFAHAHDRHGLLNRPLVLRLEPPEQAVPGEPGHAHHVVDPQRQHEYQQLFQQTYSSHMSRNLSKPHQHHQQQIYVVLQIGQKQL